MGLSIKAKLIGGVGFTVLGTTILGALFFNTVHHLGALQDQDYALQPPPVPP